MAWLGLDSTGHNLNHITPLFLLGVALKSEKCGFKFLCTLTSCVNWGELFFLFFNPYLNTCLLVLVRGEGGRERGRETSNWERSIHQLLLRAPTGDPTCNSGTCLDWEWNSQPFSLRDSSPTNWSTPARAGQIISYLLASVILLVN